MMQARVLVIDDDNELTILLKAQLERKHYRVDVASSGQEGLQKAYKIRPDLIILDVMMPGMDGWEVCERLREMSDVPIIMLTARAREEEVIRGLKNGADDYLTKPFNAKELEARITAVLRRSGQAAPDGRSSTGKAPYVDSRLSIDFERHEVKVRGELVDLTPTEFKLLGILVHHQGRVLPHRYLLNEVWGPEYTDQLDYVKLYIRYLRMKIEDDPSKPTYIHTEWGVGYRFEPFVGF
jgi:two-component system KDP operon response regulator KdpE